MWLYPRTRVSNLPFAVPGRVRHDSQLRHSALRKFCLNKQSGIAAPHPCHRVSTSLDGARCVAKLDDSNKRAGLGCDRAVSTTAADVRELRTTIRPQPSRPTPRPGTPTVWVSSS